MKKLKGILARILQIGEEEITLETSPETAPNWDSFNGLMMVAELENNYNVKFTMEEVTGVKSVADIVANLRKHGACIEND